MDDIRSVAKKFEDYVLFVRRHLHQYPELRWEEERTLAFIKAEIRKPISPDGIEIEINDKAAGGLWVDITFNPDWDRLLFRADVDALSIQEETGLPFASKSPGIMHACGHDVNAAMLLGAFRAIAEGIIEPKHNLRFVFQRAEENPISQSGGSTLVEEGVLEGVSRVHALHLKPNGGVPGIFYSRPGPLLGNSDRLKMIIKCTGGHVAMPNKGVNALRITQAIQNALNDFPVRTLGPLKPATLEPTILKAGTNSNTMPAQAEMWYGVRTMLEPKDRDQYFDAIEKQVQKTIDQFPGAALEEFHKIIGHPALHNTPGSFQEISTHLTNAGQEVEEHEPVLGGEDFAYYLQERDGSFWLLGAPQEGSGSVHTPTFNPNENIFWKGVLFWLLLATS